MAKKGFDAIVLGLGAVGSAAAYQLARSGAKVLGLDRYSPPHPFGSSHGDTRIIRKAIGEGEAYVPLVLRSYDIWREVEQQTQSKLLHVTGGLWISSSERKAETHVKDFFQKTIAAARRYRIPHEILSADEIRKGFPQFRIAGKEQGYYEPDAGYLRAEACVAANVELARRHGAELRLDEAVTSFEQNGDGVRVRTHLHDYHADQLVVCAGPWITRLVGAELAQLFTVTRQVLYWFDVSASHAQFTTPRFPVWIWELHDQECVMYGFPAIDGPAGGAKVATEQYRCSIRPESIDAVDRNVSEAETWEMHHDLVAPHIANLGMKLVKATTCLYTSTPDFQFVVDRHPQMDRVIIASPCSGHGFKHSAALGESLAALALGKPPPHDLAQFSLRRFQRASRWAVP